eukprot:3333720-Prymnesium_polylepis.1
MYTCPKLTAPPPPQQLWVSLKYSREGLRPKSGVPEKAMPSRVSRDQTRGCARTHTTAAAKPVVF